MVLDLVCWHDFYNHPIRYGIWHGSNEGSDGSREDCNSWTSTSPGSLGRASVIRSSKTLLEQNSIPCNRPMSILCVLATVIWIRTFQVGEYHKLFCIIMLLASNACTVFYSLFAIIRKVGIRLHLKWSKAKKRKEKFLTVTSIAMLGGLTFQNQHVVFTV